MEDEEKFTVDLYVYDISGGLAKALSRSVIGKQIDGVWHTNVVVYGYEFYFGGGVMSDKQTDKQTDRDSKQRHPLPILRLGNSHQAPIPGEGTPYGDFWLERVCCVCCLCVLRKRLQNIPQCRLRDRTDATDAKRFINKRASVALSTSINHNNACVGVDAKKCITVLVQLILIRRNVTLVQIEGMEHDVHSGQDDRHNN